MGIDKLIKKMKENPLWAFAWTLFLAAIGFVCSHEMSYYDTQSYFERKNFELEILKSDFDRADTLVRFYYGTIQSLSDMIDSLNQKYSDRSKLRERKMEITRDGINASIEVRERISVVLAVLNNAPFQNAFLKDMASKLAYDLTVIDEFHKKRLHYISMLITNAASPMKLAKLIPPDIEEWRSALEADGRRQLIEYSLENARQSFNTNLVEYQGQVRLLKIRSNMAILSWMYIGGFIGGSLRKLLSIRNQKRKVNTQ
jgi:hypothetical protein